jgi:hypothetical protein
MFMSCLTPQAVLWCVKYEDLLAMQLDLALESKNVFPVFPASAYLPAAFDQVQ